MTDIVINESEARDQYVASASQTVFDFTFALLDEGDLAVTQETDGTVATLVLGDDYTVTINADGTGSITLSSGATVGDILTLYRETVIERSFDYATLGDFFAEQVNEELDRLTTIQQEINTKLLRSVRLSPSDQRTGSDILMPSKADCVGKFWAWGAQGQLIASSGTGADAGLRDDLASTDAGNGAELVGQPTLYAPEYLQTVSDILNGLPVSLLRFINPTYHSGIRGGTDTHELSAEINDAIREAPTLLIPQGQFYIEDTLLFSNDRTLAGTGRNSVLRAPSAIKMVNLYDVPSNAVTALSNVTLTNFRMRGPAVAYSAGNKHCINTENVEDLVVDTMWFQDVDGDGLYLRDVLRARASNIRCANTFRQGVTATLGVDITIENVRGTGTMITLVDIEPNTGDTIDILTLRNIKHLSDVTEALRFYYGLGAYDIITNVTCSDIHTRMLGIVSISDASFYNIITESVTGSTDATLTLGYAKRVTGYGFKVKGSGINTIKAAISSTEEVTIYGLDIVGGSGTADLDLLTNENLKIYGLNIKEAGTNGIRYRDQTNLQLTQVAIDDATTAIRADDVTTGNSGTRITGLSTPNCGTAFNIDGVNGDTYIDGDISGATTKFTFGGSYTGEINYGNLIGVRREVYGYGAAPATGSFLQGDIAWNVDPDAADYIGWVCVTAGTPGTWKGFGTIQS